MSPQVWYLLFRAFESLSDQLNSHSCLNTVPAALQMNFTELQAQVMRDRYITSPTYHVSFKIQKQHVYSTQANYYILRYITQLLMLWNLGYFKNYRNPFDMWPHLKNAIIDVKLYLVNIWLFFNLIFFFHPLMQKVQLHLPVLCKISRLGISCEGQRFSNADFATGSSWSCKLAAFANRKVGWFDSDFGCEISSKFC